MQENINESTIPATGRIIAIDPGTRHVGLAVSDQTQLIPTPIKPVARKSWKKLLTDLRMIIAEYDAVAIVIGLPLNTDGSESEMSLNAREIARKLDLSIKIPVRLQD